MMRQLTTEQFIEKANLRHNNKYNYNKTIYTSSRSKVIVTCPIHGDFYQRAAKHLHNNGCPECKWDKITNLKRSTKEDFISEANIRHGNRYLYDKVVYKNNGTKVCIVCKDHGEFWQTPNSHLSQKQGCPDCAGLRKLTVEKFKHMARLAHGDRYSYDKVEITGNNKEKVTVTCRKHGDFLISPNNHISKRAGCHICSASKGELLIASILEKNGYTFLTQYRVPNQVYRFRYDFFLPDLNLLIEFHGVQHFKPVSFFGGEEGFKETRFRDAFKRSFAKELKIPLLELNYKQLKTLGKEKFESKFIEKLNGIKSRQVKK